MLYSEYHACFPNGAFLANMFSNIYMEKMILLKRNIFIHYLNIMTKIIL